MNLNFRLKRLTLKWNGFVNKKVGLLPDQQTILDNWTHLLKDKNTKTYYYRVDNVRVVASFEDPQETILRKMMILKDGGVAQEMTFTEVKPNGTTVIIDSELDPMIAKRFVDKFEETVYRRIVNLEKRRKNLINENIEIKLVDEAENVSELADELA